MSILPQTLDNLLSRLSNVQNHGNYYTACCPSHKSSGKQSLSITVADGKVLINPHCKCDLREILTTIGLTLSDLFTEPKEPQGCTLQDFSSQKKLPLDILKHYHWKDTTWNGTPAIAIPYADQNGHRTITRYRVAMTGDKFRWQKGSHPHLYGLWRINQTTKSIVIVEGESDTITLWHSDYPAIGLPGAGTWNEDWAVYFKDIEEIFVCIEPDAGGQAVIEWLKDSSIKDKVWLFTLGSYYKDVSGLYCEDPEIFEGRFAEYIAKSKPFSECKEFLTDIQLAPLRDCNQGVADVVYVG